MKKYVLGDHTIYWGDCLDVLEILPNNSVDLILTDPPYNRGITYIRKYYVDRWKKKDYIEWCKEWLTQCKRVLKENGSMYIINYPELNAYIVPFLDNELKMDFRRWITWHYPTNIGHSKKNYTRSQRSILFYTKGKNYTFNRQKLIQHYKNPEVKKIKERIAMGSRGRTSYDLLRYLDLIELQVGMIDVLDINLLKNVSKDRQKGLICQLPKALMKTLMEVSSNKGDVVLDLFSGAFTIPTVAKELGRKSIGVDIAKKYVNIGLRRLKK